MSEEQSGVYYGWYIIGACFATLGIMAGVGATFPVFLKPLAEEFEWSLTALSGAISINLIIGGLVTPFWGNWTDRSGARVVVITAASFAGLSLLLLSRIGTLWHVYLLFTLEAVFIAGMSLIPISTVVSQWFRARRGTAMGIALAGEGIGGLIMAPLSNYLIILTGWRTAYLLIGGMVWVVVIPIAALILRRRPQDMGLLPDGDSAVSGAEREIEEGKDLPTDDPERQRAAGLTLKQAAGKLSFWMIAIGFFLPMMAFIGINTHLVVIATDIGMSSQRAATCLGLLAALSILGRFGFGYAADRFSTRRLFTLCYAIETIGICTLLGTPLLGSRAFYAFMVIYGLTFGGGFALAPLIIGECFGTKTFGTIFGVLAIAGTIGGAVGPTLSGIIYDTTGDYTLAFIIYSISLAIATVAISRARSPIPQEEHG